MWDRRLISTTMSQGEDFLQKFVNHEKKGVPAGAGKDDKGGFDMARLCVSPVVFTAKITSDVMQSAPQYLAVDRRQDMIVLI